MQPRRTWCAAFGGGYARPPEFLPLDAKVNVIHFVVVDHEIARAAPKGRVERKREARAEAILDAATAIVAAEGIDALTLGRLAAALDYVPAALYRYFDSKDALVAALQRRAVREIHEGVRVATRAHASARAAPDVASLAALLATADHYLALPRANPRVAFLVALLMGDPRELLSDEESRRTAPLFTALAADVQAMFRAASDAGALTKGDDVERTYAFWAVLQGALSLEKARRIAPGMPAPVDVGRAAVAAILAGWGAAPAAMKRAERLVDGGARRESRRGSR